MTAGRARFGPVRIAWADAAASATPSLGVLDRLGASQVSRYQSLRGDTARRFITGRALLAHLVDELTSVRELEFSTLCERCGADHGRPRFDGAPIAVSVGYAGPMVAVGAAPYSHAAAVGVDIERVPPEGASRPMTELDRLFFPDSAPDIEGWTLIEAAMKADGRGLGIDLAEIEVGAIGTGACAGSRAVRIPGRLQPVDAAVIGGPAGFALSAAMVPVAGERHPG